MGGKAGFALCDAPPGPAGIARLGAIIGQRDLGRACERYLSLPRARRDEELSDHVLARLASEGSQTRTRSTKETS
jgi:hypothetical protein